MAYIQGKPGEIRELAKYEVRPEAIEEVLAAIHEFVAYLRTNEPGALRTRSGRRTSIRRVSFIFLCGGMKRRIAFTANQQPSRNLQASCIPSAKPR